MRVGTGIFSDQLGTAIGLDEGIGGEVARTGQPVAVDDYDRWAGRPATHQVGLGATMAAPLRSGGRVIGVLGLAAGEAPRTWSSRDVEALTSFARLASIALENARLVDVAQRGALYDPTTGLPNRELLSDRIAHALSGRPPGDPRSIGVILLDLDRFKVINETLGHVAGDRLLLAVGQRLVACPAAGRHRRPVRRGRVRARARSGRRCGRGARASPIGSRGSCSEPFPLNGREWFITRVDGDRPRRPGPWHARRPAARSRDRDGPGEGRRRPTGTACSSRR